MDGAGRDCSFGIYDAAGSAVSGPCVYRSSGCGISKAFMTAALWSQRRPFLGHKVTRDSVGYEMTAACLFFVIGQTGSLGGKSDIHT